MKKTNFFAAALVVLTLSGCTAANLAGVLASQAVGSGALGGAASSAASSTASMLGSALSTAASGNNLMNMITSVIGLDKVKANNLIGTWRYSRPGCAFTSEQLLAKAGGEAVAANVKDKLAATYSKVGINQQSTSFTFKQDGTFTATLLGKSLSGQYQFNEKDQSIELKTMLITLNGYVKKNSDGIALLFESKKVLTVLQTVAAISGNSTLGTISDLSTNYDGVRVGFDLTK